MPDSSPRPGTAQEGPVATTRFPRRRSVVGRILWGLFLVVNLPILGTVVAGLLAAYLSPRLFWWAQFAAIMLPYSAWALAIATFGPVLFSRWRWLVLHGFLLALVLLRTFPPERFQNVPTPGAGDLIVMTFNVPQSGPSGDALADSMEALVRQEQPDFLALQEAWVHAPQQAQPVGRAVQVNAVVERLPYDLAVPTVLSSQAAWRRNATGVPLLVREGPVEVLEKSALRLGDENDDDASMAIRTHFRWREREGVLYNVHLRSFGERKPWEDRLRVLEPGTWLPYLRQYRTAFKARAVEVAQITERLDEETLPVIVVGDFNGTAANWTYRQLRGDRIDAFRVAGEGAGHTYRSDKPLVRIDFVLADPSWIVTEAHVPAVTFSDHRPVVVRLRWRDEATPEAPAPDGPPAAE